MMTTGPQQKFETAGMDAMERPGLVTRLFMRIVAFVEGLNLKYSKVGNPPVYDNAVFPWAAALEHRTPEILKELEVVLQRQDELPGFHEISTDVRTISQDNRWKTFFLAGYGQESARNIASCPRTWDAVKNIPGIKTAMFSVLEPGKHLPAHRGPYNGVLRLHLGLIIPEPRAKLGIRVERDTHRWEQGKVIIFDDAYEHEAWNDTAETRVVLFLDFVKPMRFPANLFNWLLLNLAAFTPFIREGADNHMAWEEKFYAKPAAGE